jgi:hypothetical protein
VEVEFQSLAIRAHRGITAATLDKKEQFDIFALDPLYATLHKEYEAIEKSLAAQGG